MNIKSVAGVFFSPAGSTESVVRTAVETLAAELGVKSRYISLGTPSERAQDYQFAPEELVVFGCPVYAGRLPNKIAPDFLRCLHGNGAAAVAIVTYGGRAYDNALAEMCDTLTKTGFRPAAGGAFVCRHVFSDKLAAGRPDETDRVEICGFMHKVVDKLRAADEITAPIVPGSAEAAYYTPLKTDKKPAKFLKAKPRTDAALCNHCGKCVSLCPMGSISAENPAEVTGICIKCCACTTGCPTGAKKLDNPDFLSHTAMLEQFCVGGRKKNEIFL